MKLLTLALAGLIALAVASPTGGTGVATSMHKNDGTHSYKCGIDEVVLSCILPTNCEVIEKCATKCVQGSDNAGCVTGATTSIALAPEMHKVVGTAGTDDVDTAAKKTYECSNDHTGVLVCQYGFCSTDHYCKKGTRCSDGCACCKKGLQVVADSDKTRILPKSTELAPRGGCAPGTYTCNLNPSTNSAWIVTCNWKGEWLYSADCGSNIKCIESPAGVAHCFNPGDQWNSLDAREEPTATISLSPLETSLVPVSDQSSCPAGYFSCAWNPYTLTDWIIVCNSFGYWQLSSDCGPYLKCHHDSDAVAHCIARGRITAAMYTVPNEATAVPSPSSEV